MAVTLDPKEQKLRDDLLEFIQEEEHSDAPLRTFRITSYIDEKAAADLTIHAKTQLGAVIAFADWGSKTDENRRIFAFHWNFLLDTAEGEEDVENPSIQYKAEKLVKLMFEGGDDNHIVEVTAPEILTPFADTFRKSAGKKE